MTAPPSSAGAPPPGNGLTVGRGALRQLHASLQSHAPDQAIAVLQEAGYAAGEGTYRAFSAWLPARTGVDRPEDLDADRLNEILSDFFADSGWGTLSMSPVGTGALAVDSTDWAEAEPGTAETPMCFFSAGLLADFLGRLSGETVAVMEVECRGRGDTRCRFLSATPEVLQQVYEQMAAGRTYEEALSA
ncbi:MAG TPA: V4R domain-containing protein [Gemmatimonadales bacterium]